MVEATATADCEDLAKAKEACLAEGGVSLKNLATIFGKFPFFKTIFGNFPLTQDCSALMAGYLKCMEALKGEEA